MDKVTEILLSPPPFSAGYAYYTDWRLGGIVRVRKTDGGEMVIIRRGISHIMHVKSFSSTSQTGQ